MAEIPESHKCLNACSVAAGGRYLVLITGASRGFGRHLAVEFVRAVKDKAVDLVGDA